MSRKKEQLLWDAMRTHAPRALRLQRVENLVGEGMPDVYVGATGKWVELKAPARIPVRPDTTLLSGESKLRTSQINWLLVNAHEPKAPPAYVLIRTAAKELFLLNGALAPYINEMPLATIRERAIATDWDAIFEELGK